MGNRDAHMKEPGNSQVSTADPGRKRKKRKGGTSFSNSKQGRRRELRKKEQSSTQGSEPTTDLSKTGGEAETETSRQELQRIEEEREHSGSREPSMGESEHRSSSDMSKSEEETKEDSTSNVSLGLGICALGSHIH